MKKETIVLLGVSRNSDDTLSKDGECLELINSRTKDGSITPVGKLILEQAFPSNHKPVYVHNNAGYQHFIVYDKSTGKVYYDYKKEDGKYISTVSLICEAPSLKKIESIGNTLIMITENNIFYSLFKGDSYVRLGSKPPFPVIQFSSSGQSARNQRTWCDIDSLDWDGTASYHRFSETNATLVTNTVLGTLSKRISESTKKGYFIFPFLVRYALRLYDGSYICHSVPILILPKSRKHAYVSVFSKDMNIKNGNLEDFHFTAYVNDFVLSHLAFRPNLENWKDIISGIDIFVSKQAYTLDTDGKIEGFTKYSDALDLDINYYGEDKTINDLISSSIFYKIYSFSIEGTIPARRGY